MRDGECLTLGINLEGSIQDYADQILLKGCMTACGCEYTFFPPHMIKSLKIIEVGQGSGDSDLLPPSSDIDIIDIQ